jgi:imidazolonepropionase-like amidohydrolase
MLAALGSLLLLFSGQVQAQDSGYTRTYVIQADGAWIAPGVHIEPAFVKVSAGKVVWVSSTDQRQERTNMLGKTLIEKLIKVKGTLAPGMVDAWTTMVPTGYSVDRKAGSTRKLQDSLPMQVVNEDPLLVGQVLAARQAGIAAVFLSAGRSGWRRGVGTAAEFTKLDLPQAIGAGALEFAVGAQGNNGFERTFMIEELEAAFEEAADWRGSWDDFDEAMEKYQKDLEKYEEKLTKYIEEKKKFDEEAEKSGAQTEEDSAKKEAPKAPKRPKYPKEPQVNAGRDLILGAMDGAYAVRIHADSVSDIRRVISLKKEYAIHVLLVGGANADLLADDLRRAEIAVVLPLSEDRHAAPHTERSLAKRYSTLIEGGVEVALASGGAEGSQMLMATRAGELVAAGCDKNKVWESLTVVPARLLGLDDYGTLHRGKSATMILFEGTSPFDASAPMKAHKPK